MMSNFTIEIFAKAKDNYPEVIEERKLDQIGSILGNDGILLYKHNSSQPKEVLAEVDKKVNNSSNNTAFNYLWLAALENIKYMPLNSVDYNGGIIVTDWVSVSKNSTQRYKVVIHILDDILSLASFSVNIYSEDFKGGKWITIDSTKHSIMKDKLRSDILSTAKDLKAFKQK